MEEFPQIKLLSDVLSDSIVKVFKIGQYALVLILVGTILLLASLFFEKGIISYVIGILGSLIILTVLYYFYIRDISTLSRVKSEIQKNAEIINTIQQAAIAMTDVASSLHTVTIFYANEMAAFIVQYEELVTALRTILQSFPFIGNTKLWKLADDKYPARASDIATMILHTTHETEKITRNIRLALVQSDPKPIKDYLNQLMDLNQELKNVAEKINVAPPKQKP